MSRPVGIPELLQDGEWKGQELLRGLVTHSLARGERPRLRARGVAWTRASGLPVTRPSPPRLLQLQHHPAGCQQAPPLVLTPCDGALLVSGLQKELGLAPGPLLPPHFLQAGGSPVAAAAQLLDAHLHIGAAAPLPAASLPASLVAAGLPQADCDMEDLTSGQRGMFVLVQ